MSPVDDRVRPTGEVGADSEPVKASAASVYVVLVRTSDEKMRRRVMLSLHAAEKAARRAELRGHTAELVLCRLTQLPQPEEPTPTYFRLPFDGDAS